MKQYETVWLECEEGEKNQDWVSGYSTPIKPVENVIVLTIEELREVWEKGCMEGYEKRSNGFNAWFTGFKEYIQSKGIIL